MCSLSGTQFLLSVPSFKKWRLTEIDVKSAFLQAGSAARDVYIIPLRESSDRSQYWLRLAASYDLVTANAKWQS